MVDPRLMQSVRAPIIQKNEFVKSLAPIETSPPSTLKSDSDPTLKILEAAKSRQVKMLIITISIVVVVSGLAIWLTGRKKK